MASLTLLATLAAPLAHAAEMTEKDVQLLVRALNFLQPGLAGGGAIAIAYDPADPPSRRSAEVIAGFFGGGLKAGSAVLTPKIVDIRALSTGGFVAIVGTDGVDLSQVMAAARAQGVPCITSDVARVREGQCVMAVRTGTKVEIVISQAAAAQAHVGFASAFLMMVTVF